ncbi:hypothetical protein DSL72_000678 [Monilinia vaccinii-corymbosi]|uniref:Uncharacterized protein n=1 Tax=Monilinia vaccinii-corymbosi TaxID=61207 RepID=A0A8A3NZN5_9HELO|nr:hypothetical protein DSL72_000678 [Monilinia vaccinii-corymbosi]
MKLSNLPVLAILSFTSSVVYAADSPPRCTHVNFATGNPKEALNRINDLCKPIAGLQRASLGTTTCVDFGSFAYEVSVWNMEDVDKYLNFNVCTGFLIDLIKCPKGGVRTTYPSKWHFRLLPKNEKCLAML